jgi:hypothetical protein
MLDVIITVGAIVAVILFALGCIGAIAGMCIGPGQYEPMSFDEEYWWLTEEQGLSHEEATEIANIPWRHRGD